MSTNNNFSSYFQYLDSKRRYAAELAALSIQKLEPAPAPPAGMILCFRHLLRRSPNYCALCRAKQLAKGNIDDARQIFLNS